ncbi:restriction endonuclease subunit S [Streptococcus suis]
MSEVVSLESLCSGIIDCPHSTPNWKVSGIPVIRNYNLVSGRIDKTNLSYVTEEEFLLRTKRAVPEYEDLIISREAPMGVVGIVPEKFKCCLGQRLVLLKVDKEKCYPKFLLYSLMSNFVQKQIERVNLTGSIVSNLNISSLQDLQINLVTYSQQVDIANCLDLLDQKIAINNQINEELEAMAKTLYDYWFVQFDFPDENGKPYKSSGGKMVYNDQLKREIPEGWGVERLGDIETNIVTGKTPSRSIPENFGGDIPFITIGDIRGNTFIYSSAETLSDLGAEEQNKKYLPPNSLCVSCIATVGEIGFTTQLSQTNQQINSIIFNDVNHMYFLYFALKLFFESSKTKTGNTFANMSKDDFSKILIIYPDSSVIKNYYEKVKSMFDKIKCLQLQNQELTQLRDWLLPMLMNGQVKVEE